jgi:hypothetical protein
MDVLVCYVLFCLFVIIACNDISYQSLKPEDFTSCVNLKNIIENFCLFFNVFQNGVIIIWQQNKHQICTLFKMSCYTGFFNVQRGWQSLNTGPRFYLRLIRRTGWLWIYTPRSTDGCQVMGKAHIVFGKVS